MACSRALSVLFVCGAVSYGSGLSTGQSCFGVPAPQKLPLGARRHLGAPLVLPRRPTAARLGRRLAFHDAFDQQSDDLRTLCGLAPEDRPAGGREPVLICHPDTGAPALRVVPSGYDVPDKAPAGAIDLVVSTADGWGDGYHPTTGLSLEFLARFVDAGARPRVLDYGTGSGVLGIAALKLGCQSVIGIDIDDEALTEAAENVLANGIDPDEMQLLHTREVIQDLDGIVLRDDPAAGTLTFDLVVANILVGPLMKLAPILSLACKVGGRLCLSGLRVENLEAIEIEYAKYGIDLDQRSTRVHEAWRPGSEGEGEWAQISGTKRLLTDAERSALSAAFSAYAVGESMDLT